MFDSLVQQILGMLTDLILWLIPIMLLIGALKLLFAPGAKGREGERKIGRALERLAPEVLHDVIIPDGKGGLTQVDHVALTAAGLLVVESKNYSGLIFGSARGAKWTQKIGRKTHQFQNPLRQNYRHIKAIEAACPDVPVHGWVVFTDPAKFPKGVPRGVSQLKAFGRDYSREFGDGLPSDVYRDAWERLKALARSDREIRREHLSELEQRHGRSRRTPMAVSILVLSVGWLGALSLFGKPSVFTSGETPQAQAQQIVSNSKNDMRYAKLMADKVLDTPRCAVYRQQILEAGQGSPYSGKTKMEILKGMDAAKKAGCRKP